MNDEETNALLRELIEEVRLNRRWLRVIAWDDIQRAVNGAIEEDWEYHLFENLDGKKSTRELADNHPRSRSTVLKRLEKWKQIGVIEQRHNGKYEKIVSLEVLNIDMPSLED